MALRTGIGVAKQVSRVKRPDSKSTYLLWRISELDIPGNAKDDRCSGISRSIVDHVDIPGTLSRRCFCLTTQLALWELGHHLSLAGGLCVFWRKHLDCQWAA